MTTHPYESSLCLHCAGATITPSAPNKRFTIIRLADYAGYVPVMGTAVGVARIVSSFAAFILTSLGMAVGVAAKAIVDLTLHGELRDSDKWIEKCSYVQHRAVHEAARGFHELVPFAARYTDRQKEKEFASGIISSDVYAHGKYVYSAPLGLSCDPGSFFYAAQEISETPVKWHAAHSWEIEAPDTDYGSVWTSSPAKYSFAFKA